MRSRIAISLTLFLAAGPLAAQEQHGKHDHGSHVGVDFAVSCSADVRPAFNRATAELHSFGYEDARRRFLGIAERDPRCGMAYWGVAMTYWHALWAPPTPEEFAAGRQAAEQAAKLGAGTARERAYIAAINEFYRDAERRSQRARSLAYRDAMARLAAEFRDDEATIFHALSMLAAAPPNDTTYAAQRQAAAVLNTMLAKHPNHPGIAHYTIHAFDYPALAELALPAARIYAELAPESPHALHMPTHIFTRRGLWDESIAANIACARVANAQAAQLRPGHASFEALHCQDYMAYAYLQQADDEKARQVMERVTAGRQFDYPDFAVGYAMLAVPARYALERRDWRAAASLTVPDVKLRWEHFKQAKSLTYFANAIGAARGGDAAGARRAVATLEALHREIAENPPPGNYDWAGRVEVELLAASGWLAFAEGRRGDAVRLLTSAAVREELVGKHPVTPGAILPARELLGDLLTELGRPAEALAAYEAALADQPRRFNSLLGAARTARAAGQSDKAAGYYRQLIELAGKSTSRPAPLTEAQQYLSAGDDGSGSR